MEKTEREKERMKRRQWGEGAQKGGTWAREWGRENLHPIFIPDLGDRNHWR